MNKIDGIINGNQGTAPHQLSLDIHGLTLGLRAYDATLLQAVGRVYGRYVEEVPTTPRYQIWVFDLDPAEYMPADPSALGPYVLPDGRAKDRFLDEGEIRYVVKHGSGLCMIFDDQRYVIFWNRDVKPDRLRSIINAIQARAMIERGYNLVHCAALEIRGIGVALAGQGGAGKSTTMLKLMAAGGTYISNDRLLIRREPASSWFEMVGPVRWPRVCAGTMYADSRLRKQLPAEVSARYAALPFEELFNLREKHDVDVPAIYGPSSYKGASRFRNLYWLAWDRQQEGFAIDRVNTRDEAFWEAFGPNVCRDAAVADRQQSSSLWSPERMESFRRNLEGLTIYAVTGKLNFESIATALVDHLKQTS